MILKFKDAHGDEWEVLHSLIGGFRASSLNYFEVIFKAGGHVGIDEQQYNQIRLYWKIAVNNEASSEALK